MASQHRISPGMVNLGDLSTVGTESGGLSQWDGTQNQGRLSGASGTSGLDSNAAGSTAAGGATLSEVFSKISSMSLPPAEVATKFALQGSLPQQEKDLWHLVQLLMEDCGKTYDAEAIGVERKSATRRKDVSQYAHMQSLLQGSTTLRRVNIVQRWLEKTYTSPHDQTVVRDSKSPEEQELLYQTIFAKIRGGQHNNAASAAAFANSMLSVPLNSIPLRKVKESWWKNTDRVELFGEYAVSEEKGMTFTNNDHRTPLMSQLYDEAKSLESTGTSDSLTALQSAIYGSLSGNAVTMGRGFSHCPHWTDKLWCDLRSKLVHILLRAHQPYGPSLPTGCNLLSAIDSSCGATGANWVASCETYVEQEIQTLLRQFLTADNGNLHPMEILQIKLIQLFLSNGRSSDVVHMQPTSPGTLRAHSHLLLLLNEADLRQWIDVAPQQSPVFCSTLVTYCGHVVLQGTSTTGAQVAKFALPLLCKIKDSTQRASAYASLLGYVRRRCRFLFANAVDSLNVSINTASTGAAAGGGGLSEAIEREESDVLQEIKVTESNRYGSAALLDQVLQLMSSTAAGGAQPIEELIFDADFDNNVESPFRAGRAAGIGARSPASVFGGASVAGSAGTSSQLVRPHEKAEAIAWLAKTEDPVKLQDVLDLALQYNADLWALGEFSAVRDIVETLGHRVVNRLTEAGPKVVGVAQADLNNARYFFWDAVVKARQWSDDYVATVKEIQSHQLTNVRRVLLQELSQKEIRIKTELHKVMLQCLETSTSVSESVAGPIASTIASVIVATVASFHVLVAGANPGEKHRRAPSSKHQEEGLKPCMKYLSQFEATGRMATELTAAQAQVLMLHFRRLRMEFNMCRHDDKMVVQQ